jgi:hypothetical protein
MLVRACACVRAVVCTRRTRVLVHLQRLHHHRLRLRGCVCVEARGIDQRVVMQLVTSLQR